MRYVTLGEIMLRLKPPGHERLLQSPVLEATFGGGEANVAVSLATFGLDAAFVTALPDNDLGDAAVAELRRHAVDVSHIVRRGERMGLYFLESGSGQRPSRVIYDRTGSALATAPVEVFDWEAIFAGDGWLHLTGITPALSASAADLALTACRQARARGWTVSCDFNYRARLWNYGRSAAEVMTELVKLVDVGIANREDCRKSLGMDLGAIEADDALDIAHYEALSARVLEAFPNLATIAITLRESISADHNRWSACLRDAGGFIVARQYEMTDIAERIGGGDAFAAGLVHGLSQQRDRQHALEFATAAGCLKHSIAGDFNRVTVAEVESLVAGHGSGRVLR